MLILIVLSYWNGEAWGGDVKNLSLQEEKHTEQQAMVSVEQYWAELRRVADELYDTGILKNVLVSLGGGMQHKEFENGPRDSAYGTFSVSLPLISRDKKIALKEAKRAFLKEGSGYIQEIGSGRRLLAVLRENLRIKKQLLQKVDLVEDFAGQETRIEEYLALSERIVAMQGQVRGAERKLEAMVGAVRGEHARD